MLKRKFVGNTVWESILLISLDTFMLLAVMGITLGIVFMVVNSDIPNKKLDYAPRWGQGRVEEDQQADRLAFIRALAMTKKDIEFEESPTLTINGDSLRAILQASSLQLNSGRTIVVVNPSDPNPPNSFDGFVLYVTHDDQNYSRLRVVDRQDINNSLSISFSPSSPSMTATSYTLHIAQNMRNHPFWRLLLSLRSE